MRAGEPKKRRLQNRAVLLVVVAGEERVAVGREPKVGEEGEAVEGEAVEGEVEGMLRLEEVLGGDSRRSRT
jgi:hypothetical protein